MTDFTSGVRIVSSHQNKSKPYGKIQSRATHGFIFKIRGSSEYYIDGKTISLGEGEMIFLPRGLSYEYRTDNPEDSLYTSINFLSDIECGEYRVYSVENFYLVGYIYQSFSELWRFGTMVDRYACMSVFYELLAFIEKSEADSSDKSRYSIIEPAVEYMKKHIYDTSFRVDRLHSQCGISDTYFRKLFKLRFGLAPKEYVVKERLSHARAIIESGDYNTIREVAEMVGFSDALYFSKAFRWQFGVAPTGIIG